MSKKWSPGLYRCVLAWHNSHLHTILTWNPIEWLYQILPLPPCSGQLSYYALLKEIWRDLHCRGIENCFSLMVIRKSRGPRFTFTYRTLRRKVVWLKCLHFLINWICWNVVETQTVCDPPSATVVQWYSMPALDCGLSNDNRTRPASDLGKPSTQENKWHQKGSRLAVRKTGLLRKKRLPFCIRESFSKMAPQGSCFSTLFWVRCLKMGGLIPALLVTAYTWH